MQIHELTQLKEASTLGSALGLNNTAVSQAWSNIGSDVMDTAAARRTKDPRYVNLPLDQRIDVMRRDAQVKQQTQKLFQEFNEYNKRLMYANNNQPLTNAQFAQQFGNWMNRRVFNGHADKLTAPLSNEFQRLVAMAAANRDNQRFNDAFDKIVSMSLVAKFATAPMQTTVAKTPSPPTVAPPKPGAPTAAEQEKLQQRIQAALQGKE